MMIKVLMDKEYESSRNVLHNYLATLISYIYNLTNFDIELMSKEKKDIELFIEDALDVYSQIIGQPVNKDIQYFSQKPKLRNLLEEIEELHNRISGALITVCNELNNEYMTLIRPIIFRLEDELRK